MFDPTWDLTPIYQNQDMLQHDIRILEALLEETGVLLKQNLSPQEMLGIIVEHENQVSLLIRKTMGYVQLCLATNCDDEESLRVQDQLSQVLLCAKMADSKVVRYVSHVEDLEAVIDGEETLHPYRYWFLHMAEEAKHLLPSELEGWMLKLSLSGADAFGKLRNRLMGSLMVDYKGEKMPLPAIRGLAYDPDPQVRKEAYQAEIASYQSVETAMAYCLYGIKREAVTMSEAKGYTSVLSEQLAHAHMDEETLTAMMTAIKEHLPTFQKYLRTKAKWMGHANGLPFYELFAPVGTSVKQYSAQEARDLLVKVFGDISEDMGAFMAHAFDHRWIDLYPKQGKEGGAFCEDIYSLKQSRILSNFVGSFSDVSTLAHELGHAWHNRCLENKPVVLADSPMPLAETASIFNETLLSHVAMQTADDQTRFTLLESRLMESTQTVVDIYSRFLFESAVVEASKTRTPSASELCDMMLTAQQEAYGEGLDPDIRHPYMWVNKGHYYMNDLHFYNFPYAFGLLFGLGVYAQYQKQGKDFLTTYNQMLSMTGSHNVVHVAKHVGIDVRDVNYWRSALSVIQTEVDAFKALCRQG